MTDLLNPYIAGAPVVAADMFFGRADIFEWVEHSLMGRYVDHILVIHGQRRVGKTSILKQLPNHLPERYVQVFLDLQGRTTSSLGRFLWWLSREVSRAMQSSHQVKITIPARSEFEANPELLFTRFLPEVQSALDGRSLLLTFDEFDTLNDPGVAKTLALPLIQTLRRMMELEGLCFIYSIGSSGQKLENMQARYTEFFKSALYRKISFLELGACAGLITQPVAGVLAYQAEAVERIYQVTAGHPYFTQLVCHELFSRCQQSGVREIQRADVDGVLGSVIERGTVNLKFVWDEADDLEKWALACLARADECRDPLELARTLQEQRVRFSESDLNRAIVHLREKDVLGDDNRFVVYLLRLWLRQNRPLERVREELVEVSPIANRYIEIGEEYWARGERESALENFRQALEVDPDSLKAHVHLASLLLEVGQEREAVEAFETALEIDAEDINALRGYCKVQLSLGDKARAGGDVQAALESYQAILAVNPEYQLARERLAAMYGQRAEAHLLDGNDEGALLAFQSAVRYTPQDTELAERFVQVKEGRLQGAVANMTTRAENAAAADQWETALTTLQDALLIVGKDVGLEKRLAEVKAGQRVYLLRTLPQSARRFEAKGDWGHAVETWRAYLRLYPEDLPDAETALAHAQQMLKLGGQYAEAQAALDARDYSSAIQLLQGIVHVDPGYKDTTRLLTSAVKSSQRSATNHILRYGWYAFPLVFILLIVGAYLVFGNRNKLSGLSFFNRPSGTPTEANFVGMKGSPTPTRTAAALYLSATQIPASISTETPDVSVSPQISPTLPVAMVGCFLTNAAIPRDAPGEDAAEVANSGGLDAYTPISVRNFDTDEQGNIWVRINWEDSDMEDALGYVSARDLSLDCFDCKWDDFKIETNRSDLNDPEPSSSDIDTVDYNTSLAIWKVGEKMGDEYPWVYVYGPGEAGQDARELGWMKAMTLPPSCLEKMGSVICTVLHTQKLFRHPDPDNFLIQTGNVVNPGEVLVERETIVGVDGKFWSKVGGEGFGFWLPTDSLTTACSTKLDNTSIDMDFCTVTRATSNKDEPDPEYHSEYGNYSYPGDHLTIRDRRVGSDGQDWYRVFDQNTDGVGWVPASALNQHCK